MDKGHIRSFFRQFQPIVHVTKRTQHDHLGTSRCHLIHDTGGVRTFGNILRYHSLNAIAKSRLDGLSAVIQFVGPANITDWRGVHETDLQLSRTRRVSAYSKHPNNK